MAPSRSTVFKAAGLLLCLAAFGCKPRTNEAQVKDNESIDNTLTRLPLGQGLRLPPVGTHPELTAIQPAQAVCVMPPDQRQPPPVHADCQAVASGLTPPGQLPTSTPAAIDKPKAPPVAKPTDPKTTGTKPKKPKADETAPEEAPAEEPPAEPEATAGGANLTGDGASDAAFVEAVPELAGAVLIDASGDPGMLPSGSDAGLNLAGGGGANTQPPPAIGQAMGGDWTGDISIVTNQKEAEEVTQLNLQVGSAVPVISGGVSAQVRNELKDTESHFYVVFRLIYKGFLDTISNPAPSADLARAITEKRLTDSEGFYQYCGNRYMHDRLMGGAFYGVAKFDVSQKARMKDIQLALAEVRSTYTPGVEAGGGVRMTNTMKEAFSSASIKYHKIGGADRPHPLTLEGMVTAMGDFICTAAQYPAPMTAWLSSYQGGLAGAIPKDLIVNESDLLGELAVANANLGAARSLSDYLDSYPQFQQTKLTSYKEKLTGFITKVKRAVDTCRSLASKCIGQTRADLSLDVPLKEEDLPKQMATDIQVTPGKTYYLTAKSSSIGSAGMYCPFGFNDKGFGSGVAQVRVEIRGSDLDGEAAVWLVLWRRLFAYPTDYSYAHETKIGELSPWLKKMQTNQMSNADLRDLLNTAFVPQTGNDGTWKMTGNCWTK